MVSHPGRFARATGFDYFSYPRFGRETEIRAQTVSTEMVPSNRDRSSSARVLSFCMEESMENEGNRETSRYSGGQDEQEARKT